MFLLLLFANVWKTGKAGVIFFNGCGNCTGDHRCKVFGISELPHMALNKFYSHRDNPCEVYELVEMKASTACFTHKPFFKEAITKEVQHEDLKNWRKWSKDVPALILQKTVVALQPTKSNHFSVEEAKLQVQFGLHQCYKEPLPLAPRMLCFWPNKKTSN